MKRQEQIERTIESHSVETHRSCDRTYRSLSCSAVESIAMIHQMPPRHVENLALASDIIPERYVRNFDTLGPEDQRRLLDATVAVVGLGGLGGAVCELLARAGVGRLILIDGDRFEESNLNRQLLATMAALGRPKALTAKERLKAINPSVEVIGHGDFLSESNAMQRLEGCLVAVDCLDNLKDRFVLEKAAKRLHIPLVSAALAGGFGQLMTVFPEDEGLSLVYGSADTVPEKGAEIHLGTLGCTAMLMAALECAEVIKILTGKGEPVRNQLLVMDLWNTRMEVLSLGA
ncbi:HesA/MoeB/ThiF family protein [Desulfatirhabdium butyrativorans]|uniref:HesA/MoeB/ThiF family protein n=1 Tax=Desulfatirhabdium butyrativorans TaxID=340467 RepID=UPI000426340B|nr:HesA/MoeB/ThiF family protein [Desulfatirhabdium butyrativorans]